MSAFTWPPERSASAAAASPSGEHTPAAVLVPLFLDGDPPAAQLVLTRRRSDLRRHAGEIAFPGGRRDDTDADLLETALREAEEEIGLPRSSVTVLGPLPPVSTFATNYIIHPFVSTIPQRVAWKLSPREVDAVIELPVEGLDAARTRTQMRRRGISFETDAFVVDDHVIWGATARILDLLLGRLEPDPQVGGLALRAEDAGGA